MTILIVDDEPLIRIGLKHMIDWDLGGWELSGESTNGQDVLQFIKDYDPDVVITDINMPLMDGITLISKAYEGGFEGKFIVLTVLDDFEHARAAMKSGASDYLVKYEMNRQIIMECLNKVSKSIPVKKRTGINTPMLHQEKKLRFLEDMIRKGNTNEDEIPFGQFICVKISLDSCLPQEKDLSVLDKSLRIVIGDFLLTFKNAYLIGMRILEYCIIIEDPDEGILKTAEEMSVSLKSTLLQYFNINYSVNLSAVSSGAANLKSAYEGITDGKLVLSSSLGDESKSDFSINDDRTKLRNLLEQFEIQQVTDYLEDLGNKVSTAQTYSQKEYRQFSHLLTNVLENFSSSISPKEALSIESADQISTIQNSGDFQYWLFLFIKDLIKLVSSPSVVNPLIQKAVKYVEENFNEDINLNSIANHLHISPNYFSSIFSKEYGISFSRYLNMMKIAKAKILLKTTTLSITDIATQCGYNNIFYFSKTFKKLEGETPVSYRNKMVGKSE